MRHFYVRLVLGILFIICMAVCFITANLPFALFYLVMGGACLYSSYGIWKKGGR